MGEIEECGARPTLNVMRVCLTEPTYWIDIEQFRAVQGSRFPEAGPLSSLGHPIIKAGLKLTSDPRSGHGYQIHASTHAKAFPTLWRELKSGQWRGLITQQDDAGQWWIVFAGLEREGDAADVYKLIRELGDDDIKALYPTADDQKLLRLESAKRVQTNWEQDCIDRFLDFVSSSIRENKPIEFSLPSHPSHVGAKLDVSVDIERLDEVDNSASTPAEIMLTIELNGWTDGNLKRSLVTLLLQEIDPVRENWDAVSDNGTTLMYSLLTTESQLQAIANPLPRNSQEACLVRAEPGGLTITLAHYLLKRVITDAHVYGRPRKALCGQWLVPSQNPDSLEVCPKCDEIHRSFASS